MIRTVYTAGGCDLNVAGRRSSRAARVERRLDMRVGRCLQRMGGCGQRKGEVVGLEWSSFGSTLGAPGILARRRLVLNRGNRRPTSMGLCETSKRMPFARVTEARLHGPGRSAFRLARPTGWGETLARNERIARAATAEQARMRSVPAPYGLRPSAPALAQPQRAAGRGPQWSRGVSPHGRSEELIPQCRARGVVL